MAAAGPSTASASGSRRVFRRAVRLRARNGVGAVRSRDRKRAATERGDAARAWLFLRHVGDYEAAWQARAALPAAFEPGPFPIRIQTAADLEATRFDLLAWADPRDADGSASPFWVQAGMVEAVFDPEAEPLVRLVAAGGGAVEGLRLMGGGLVLKIECGGEAVQIRIRGTAAFPEDGGIEIRHRFGLRMPQTVRRMLDFWSVAGLPAPRKGRVRGGGGSGTGEGAGRAEGGEDAAPNRRGHLRGGRGRGQVAHRRLDALADAALDREGRGPRRRRLAKPGSPLRVRRVTGVGTPAAATIWSCRDGAGVGAGRCTIDADHNGAIIKIGMLPRLEMPDDSAGADRREATGPDRPRLDRTGTGTGPALPSRNDRIITGDGAPESRPGRSSGHGRTRRVAS